MNTPHTRLPPGIRHDRKGITSIEYAIAAGLLTVVIISGFSMLGTGIAAKITTVGTKILSIFG